MKKLQNHENEPAEMTEWKPAQRLPVLVLPGTEYKVAVLGIFVRQKGKLKCEQRNSSRMAKIKKISNKY